MKLFNVIPFLGVQCLSLVKGPRSKLKLDRLIFRRQPYLIYQLSKEIPNVVNGTIIRTFASDKTGKSLATLDAFSDVEEKNKDSYLDLLHFYKNKDVHRRGHVEFIYAALKHMKEFGVHKDLEAYKKLIDVMPKGKFVAQNVMQAEFQHYPKQQQCLIDLLEQMEINAVCPDVEMEATLINIFGRRSYAIRRYWRMMYWMPKMRNLSPWPVPEPLPEDNLELAKLAIERITSVDPTTKVSVLQTKEVSEALDDTWIVSGQSESQRELVSKHNKANALYIEGSFRVWLRGTSVNYFILRADPVPETLPERDPDNVSKLHMPMFEQPQAVARPPIVHQQEDGTIMAVCATGTSSRDSLLSWVRLLQRDNPRLGEIPVLFTFKSPMGPVEPLAEIQSKEQEPVSISEPAKPT